MNIQPYLFFDGRCEQAFDFYRKSLGAKVEFLTRFKDNPDRQYNPPNSGEKVMHACLRIGDTQIMASDGNCQGKPSFQGFSLTINAANPAEARERFDALAEGGQVQMPLNETFFAKSFGMVADRFGVSWMVIAEPKNPAT
jgi:PhnB protein